jgi:hypothetical protein
VAIAGGISTVIVMVRTEVSVMMNAQYTRNIACSEPACRGCIRPAHLTHLTIETRPDVGSDILI